jgi:hypothetical protein
VNFSNADVTKRHSSDERIRLRADRSPDEPVRAGRAPQAVCASWPPGDVTFDDPRAGYGTLGYGGAEGIPVIGPAYLIVGACSGTTSPVRAPGAINYLLVALKPRECWTYEPPPGHVVRWGALAKGPLGEGERLSPVLCE